ncbi:MAG: hypothetical protein EWV67_11835 [Microcystis sp. M_QC_C_20170808_M2Col]|nr:MAG: hypothetical protein EWV67_11835 [Microcystis sp. M_QC_C_20170808_M2Col]TRT73209.1 MAG: hypothetical protein EWV68_00655 [Microcystis sp. M_QC_C_20170808_M9Col]
MVFGYQSSGVSPDEKIFTPTDERCFFPYTPHPTPYTLFQVGSQEIIFICSPHTLHPTPYTPLPTSHLS